MTRRQKYFLKQKLLGVLLLIVTVVAVITLEGDLTPACVTVPICCCLFSKEMLLTDSYYFDVKEGKIQEDEES